MRYHVYKGGQESPVETEKRFIEEFFKDPELDAEVYARHWIQGDPQQYVQITRLGLPIPWKNTDPHYVAGYELLTDEEAEEHFRAVFGYEEEFGSVQ